MERHALVIGNSSYVDQALANPGNDATDMAAQLSNLGYKVHGGGPILDLDRIGIERTVLAFSAQLPKQAHVLFYYAGHGLATERDNYLIPINHSIAFEEQLADRAVSFRSIVERLKVANPNGINVLLLDACRDNPLPRNYRSSQRGLKRIPNIPQGVFIGFAADYGQVADDGEGRNGAYTAELLRMLRDEPNIIIELAHMNVRNRVFENTSKKQSPISENKIYGGDWCFGECNQSIVTTRVEPIVTVPEETEPVPGALKKRWIVVGGVVLAVVAASLASDDSSNDNTLSVDINN
ncbi:MAG: caspase domain-containing protein [Granulosicoccus sp.]